MSERSSMAHVAPSARISLGKATHPSKAGAGPGSWAAALVLCFACGCSVDQAAEVATYRQVLDGEKPLPVVPFDAKEDLDLQRALTLANQHNENLVLQGESYLQALIDENRAAASFLPTINLTPSFHAAHNSGGIGTTTAQNLPLNGSINIFNGFRDVAIIESTQATSEQRRQLLLDEQATLMLSVAQTFYQILRSEQSSEVLTSSLKLQAERLRDIRARLKLGIAKPLDVAQTEADEAAAQVALIQSKSDARTGRATLAFLIGMHSVEGKLVDAFEAPETVAPPEELETEAQESRQDLLAARSAVVAAQHDVDAAFRQYYPSVNLSASYIISQTPSFGSVWNLALSGLIPIFNAGLIHDDVRAAWSRYRQSAASESLLSRQVAEDVQIAYENLTTSRNKVSQLQVEVTAAQRAYDLSDRSYQLGGASNLDRLTAQNTLLTAQLQLTSELFNLKVFYLDLLRAMGQTLRATP
jgi:outer membrane protein TolC